MSINNNFERMKQAHAHLCTLYATPRPEEIPPAKLEEELKEAMSELGNAQDALVKGIERRRRDMPLKREGPYVAQSPVKLSLEEVEDLATTIKQEDNISYYEPTN